MTNQPNKPNKLRLLLAASFLLLSFAPISAQAPAPAPETESTQAPDPAKPVLIFGVKYGQLERQAIIKDVLNPAKLSYDDGEDFVSAETWPAFSCVIVCDEAPALKDPRELQWVRDYVFSGGRLILIGTALSTWRDSKPDDLTWLGSKGISSGAAGDPSFGSSTLAADLLPADETARRNIAQALTGSTHPTQLQGAKPLILLNGKPVAFANTWGSGQVIHIGRELFRARTADAKDKDRAASDALARWVTQLLQGKDAITWQETIKQGLARQNITGPTAWFRDPATAGRGATYFPVPYPSTPAERTPGIDLDMGMSEFESFPLYVSTPVPAPSFAVTVSDLKGSSGVIPAGKVRVRIQGLAKPSLTVGTYWLLDAENPGQFPLEENTTSTFWFTLDTRGVAPGDYQGQITLGGQSVPLKLKVWPVNLPGLEYFEAQATSMWKSIGGDVRTLAKDGPEDLTVFNRHLDNLADHHISYNTDVYWVLANFSYARLRADGQPLAQAIKDGKVSIDALPDLDLTALNPYVDAAALRGMPYFHALLKNLSDDWISIARGITRGKLENNSPEHQKIKAWLLRQIALYLSERGIRRTVSFIADEIAPSEIHDVNDRSALLNAAGIKPMLTVTGMVGKRPEMIAQLRSSIGVWIWNQQIMPDALGYVRQNPQTIKPGDLMYTYTADWHQPSYAINRQRGAYYASLGLNGWFIHGYLRWYPNGGGVFAGPNGPIDTEGWEGARDGIEDARYYARLAFLIDLLSKNPKTAAKAKELDAQLKSLFQPSDSALVTLKSRTTRYNVPAYGGQWTATWEIPRSNLQNLRTLKRILLQGITDLQQSAPLAGAAFGTNIIAVRGVFTAHVAGQPDAAKELTAAACARMNLKQLSAPTPAPTSQIVIGSEADSPVIRDAIAAGILKVTPVYPATADFLIVDLPPATGQLPTTILYARDAQARTNAIKQWSMLLIATRPTLPPPQ